MILVAGLVACCNRVLNLFKDLTSLPWQHTDEHNVRFHDHSLIIKLGNHSVLLREWSQEMRLASADNNPQIIEAGLGF